MKARAVNLVGFGPLTHRLDEYLSGMNTVDAQHADDLVAFADRISALLDGEKVALDDVATVLRQLPQQNSFNVADVTVMDKAGTQIGRAMRREKVLTSE